ncbi:hypothetical protein VUR80DRAFT_4871 [Thermomyces stellatus]
MKRVRRRQVLALSDMALGKWGDRRRAREPLILALPTLAGELVKSAQPRCCIPLLKRQLLCVKLGASVLQDDITSDRSAPFFIVSVHHPTLVPSPKASTSQHRPNTALCPTRVLRVADAISQGPRDDVSGSDDPSVRGGDMAQAGLHHSDVPDNANIHTYTYVVGWQL